MTELETRLSETLICLSRQYKQDQDQLADHIRDLQQQIEHLKEQQLKISEYLQNTVQYLKRELEQ